MRGLSARRRRPVNSWQACGDERRRAPNDTLPERVSPCARVRRATFGSINGRECRCRGQNTPKSCARAKRAGHRCANPGCRQPTSGPQDSPAGAINVGVAAHITAASIGFARYNPNFTPEQRASADNGIWLCQTCAKLIDNDEVHYDIDRVRNWKRGAEEGAKRALEERHAKPEVALSSTVEDSALAFIEATGVYFDATAKLHVCPRCKANGKRCYLKNGDHGFSCTSCTGYFSDPARPHTSAHVSYRPTSPWS
jgi:hypothetical protein